MTRGPLEGRLQLLLQALPPGLLPPGSDAALALALAAGRIPGTEVVLPPEPRGKSATALVDELARAVLHQSLSETTRATLLRAVGHGENDVMPDGESRTVDQAKVAGLLLGSPEFQKQ